MAASAGEQLTAIFRIVNREARVTTSYMTCEKHQ